MRYDIWEKQRGEAVTIECGLKVLMRDSNNPKYPYLLMVWLPKASKPYINYVYPNQEQRQERLNMCIKNQEHRQSSKMLRKLERQGVGVNISEAVKVGDIFNFSWGYDQTNQDYYQVIEINGRMLTLGEIKQESVGNRAGGSMSCDVVPIKGAFTEKAPIKKLVQFSNGKPYIKMAPYGWCDLWDGRPQYKSWYA